jgi:hypothetical protein
VIPVVSEQTVHESESVELIHVTETVTIPVDKIVETTFDNETVVSESDVNQGNKMEIGRYLRTRLYLNTSLRIW